MKKLRVKMFGHGPALVMLHGWGANSAVWQAIIPLLADRFTIHCIDLPGHGANVGCLPAEGLDGWLQLLLDVAPENAIWLGWSLGGELALAFAARYPEQITRLIMVASSPKFVESEGWPHAMSVDLFETFRVGVQTDVTQVLEHFSVLQSLGSARRKEVHQQLSAALKSGGAASLEGLNAGLNLLQILDLRREFSQLSIPVLVFLGECDKLVPVEVGQVMRVQNPAVDLAFMADSGHVPFLSQPEAFMTRVMSWV